MTSNRVPSDFVKAVLHYLGKNTRFPASKPSIQNSFYEVCKMSQFAPLCENIVFDTSSIYPHSETISFAFDRLQKADLLACRNPGLDEYEITEQLGDEGEDIKKLFNAGERTLLKEAAKVFKEKVFKEKILS